MFHAPNERHRYTTGPLGSAPNSGPNGAFRIPVGVQYLQVVASNGSGWEHVSVSARGRCPSWEEMCAIKDMFWDEDDVVVQYHPRKSEYVNCHPFTLHLWRPLDHSFPTPPAHLVGNIRTSRKQ